MDVPSRSRIYGIVTASVCYLLPWISLVVAVVVAVRAVRSEKRKERKANRGLNRLMTQNAFFFANAHLWAELRNVAVLAALLVIYAFLLAPYVILVKVDQISRTYDLQYYRNLSSTHYVAVVSTTTEAPTTLDPPSGSIVASDEGNDAQNNTQHDPAPKIETPDRVPEVHEDFLGPHDAAVVWLRFIHAALVPVLVFAVHKELRKKAKDLLCCCWRPNSVENASPRPVSSYLRMQRKKLREKQRNGKSNITNYT